MKYQDLLYTLLLSEDINKKSESLILKALNLNLLKKKN